MTFKAPKGPTTSRFGWRLATPNVPSSGLEAKIWQYFTVFPGCRSVGVVDRRRTYGDAIVLRAIHSLDAMAADVAQLPYDLTRPAQPRVVASLDSLAARPAWAATR